jgi:EAL domain-containing protein (putative c-di-GMP-specific phosphodiesterase class I)
VLAQATAKVAGWNRESPAPEPLWVSVNISARQLGDSRLPGVVAEVLRVSGLAPALLHLEITETAVMVDVARSIVILEELEALGVNLSIDDFGTGYSSLAYLKQLPVNVLKVDRSFISGLVVDPDDTSIVAAVIGLGQALGLRCIAEGVETAGQLAALVDLGCEMGQGYLWSRPLAPGDADRWVANAMGLAH